MISSKVIICALTSVLFTLVSCGDSNKTQPNVVIKGTNSSTSSFLELGNKVTAGSPTTIVMKLYGVAVSNDADCSDPQVVFDIENNPREFDMVDSPTLFAGVIANGTYNCVIMQVSDNIKYKVNQVAVDAHVGCVDTATEYIHDIYRTDNGGSVWKNVDGDIITATGSLGSPGEDKVDIVATTDSVAAIANGWHADQVVDLSAGLVVPGNSTFFADFNNGIDNASAGGNDYCVLEDGGFGFR